MEERKLIDLKEILRRCPKGMPLDCDLSDNVTFVEVLDNAYVRPIVVNIEGCYTETLDTYGCIYPYKGGKCVIWPAGRRTWEGFVPPVEFPEKNPNEKFLLEGSHFNKSWVCHPELLPTKELEASVDLQEEIERYIRENGYDGIDTREEINNIAHHFSEWQKQQMLKIVVLETEVFRDSDGDDVEVPCESWLALRDPEITSIPENIGIKEGDKVKIIIIDYPSPHR